MFCGSRQIEEGTEVKLEIYSGNFQNCSLDFNFLDFTQTFRVFSDLKSPKSFLPKNAKLFGFGLLETENKTKNA